MFVFVFFFLVRIILHKTSMESGDSAWWGGWTIRDPGHLFLKGPLRNPHRTDSWGPSLVQQTNQMAKCAECGVCTCVFVISRLPLLGGRSERLRS